MSGEAPLAGAVLCGGRSLRMGRDKALLRIGDERLLDRVAGRLAQVADPVILAAGKLPLKREGCLVVADTLPGRRGPLSGLVASLRASPHPSCAVVAVDMPDVDPLLLRDLAGHLPGYDAVVPLSPRGPEPLHAVYSLSALAPAEAALASTDRSLRGLLRRLHVRLLDVAALYGADRAARFARNLNVPADLSSWGG